MIVSAMRMWLAQAEILFKRLNDIARVGLAITLALLLLLVWYLLASPLLTNIESYNNEIKILNKEIQIFKDQLQKIQAAGTENTTELLKKEIVVRQSELAGLSHGVSRYRDQSSTTSEKQVFIALRKLIDEGHGLALINLKSLPPELLLDTVAGKFYEYPIELTLKGDFSSILNYFKAVDDLALNLYWQDMHYQVIAYPNAEINIRCYVIKFVSAGAVVNAQ